MKKTDLNGIWHLFGNGYECDGKIPGSLYSFLLDAGLMQDPYYRDNELKAHEIANHHYTFSRKFEHKNTDNEVFLVCEGLDTVCDIRINGKDILSTDNMHIRYRFPVSDYLISGENSIEIYIHPSAEYIEKRQKEKDVYHFKGFAVDGYNRIRKAECMHGWDWGPMLPDMGIWRNIYLLEKDSAEITDFHITQRHENGKIFIFPRVETDSETEISISLTDPKGNEILIPANEEYEIKDPLLWWPNNLGEQNIYKVKASIKGDEKELKIGLRTLELIREKDEYGESFYHRVNGVPFFAMGADYIPEDNIFSRITPDRTRRLLEDCIAANHNAIRVWGGGYYPDDRFFDLCDELGLVVFMDMMFACALFHFDDKEKASVEIEIEQNLIRMRNHACIGVISGNNECEIVANIYKKKHPEDILLDEYLDLFENLIPNAVKRLCPYIPYISSSPTSYGGINDPENENIGDSHYWDVWQKGAPFYEYRNHYFRYLSEFGFQSFPCEKTVNAFTLPEDRNIFSRIMDRHQRRTGANGKIMNYTADTFLYPTEFGAVLYASQLLQMEAIKYGAEHMRRNRGRCMGTLYWQLNDIWPVTSWASIDYFGRWKALHYASKRFYNPIMISCLENGEQDHKTINEDPKDMLYVPKARLFVNNDTKKDISGKIVWKLISNKGEIIKSGEKSISVPQMSVYADDTLEFEGIDVLSTAYYYSFEMNGNAVSSGSVFFTRPKYFKFADPELSAEIEGDEIVVKAKAFAKSIEIDDPENDFILEDNYFDMLAGERRIKILRGHPDKINLRSVYNIK